MKAYVVEKQQA